MRYLLREEISRQQRECTQYFDANQPAILVEIEIDFAANFIDITGVGLSYPARSNFL